MVGLLKYRKMLLSIFLAVIMILPFFPVFGEKMLVIDDADLMTEEEVMDLNERANALSEEFNMDIVIVTTDDTGGKTSREYADDYYDYGEFGVGPDYDGFIFLLDMDNREAYVSATGIGIRYFTDERKESILDMVFEGGLPEGDYYGAALGFLEGTEYYLLKGIPSDQYNEPEEVIKENKLTGADIVLSLLGGLGVGGGFVLNTKMQYKFRKKGNPYSYRNNSVVHFHSNQDNLINSFVTHRIIPKPKPTNTTSTKSTSGRSTTHRSSSGRTHSGRGRKF